MAAEIKVLAELGLNSSGFGRGIDGASAKVRGFQAQVVNVGRSLRGAFSAVGVGVGFAAVLGGIKNIVSGLAAINDAAANLNVTTDALQALQYVAADSGNSFEQVQNALAKLGVAQGRVVDDKRIAEAFAALGLSAEKVRQLKLEDLLAEVGAGFTGAANRADALVAVSDIFGERVGPKLVQMLEMVSGGMSEVVDEARKAGVVVDEVTIKIADNLDTAFQVALTRIKAGIAETLLFWRPLRQEVEDFDKYQKTIAENEALNKANISSRWGKFTDAQKARFDPERFNAERPVVDQKAAAKAAEDIAKAAERERDAIRESAVLRARINEEAARTDEEREKARIARLYAEMKAAQKAVNDPTDPAQSIAEREQETLRRQLDYERKRAELTEAVEGQSKGKIEKELKAFFNEIDNASPVAARSTRFARSSYEAIGAQVGGASRADISVQGDQLRRINEGIQEVNRNLKSVEVAIETANREPDI